MDEVLFAHASLPEDSELKMIAVRTKELLEKVFRLQRPVRAIFLDTPHVKRSIDVDRPKHFVRNEVRIDIDDRTNAIGFPAQKVSHGLAPFEVADPAVVKAVRDPNLRVVMAYES